MRAGVMLFAATAVVLGACRDSGLPDRNLPLEEAEHRAPDALVQAVHPAGARGASETAHGMPRGPAGGPEMAARPITIGEQTFVASGRPFRMESGSLRAVGGGPAGSFSAALGDEPPYSRLYLAHPGGLYVAYLPVHDASGDPVARAEALRHALESGEPAAH